MRTTTLITLLIATALATPTPLRFTLETSTEVTAKEVVNAIATGHIEGFVKDEACRISSTQ